VASPGPWSNGHGSGALVGAMWRALNSNYFSDPCSRVPSFRAKSKDSCCTARM